MNPSQDGSLEIDGVLQPYILNGYVPGRETLPMLKGWDWKPQKQAKLSQWDGRCN